MEGYDGRERRAETCNNHERNTNALDKAVSEIAGIQSSMYTGRWIFGIVIGVAMVIIGATLSNIQTSLEDVRRDIKTMLPETVRVNNLESDVESLEERTLQLEKDRHSHR
jgi:hypothetical protein